MMILGIETSCDETATAILECTGEFGTDFSFKVLGNALFSQASMHAQFGGVFPNMAKREHAKNLTPLLEAALKEAGLAHPSGHNSVIPPQKIDAIEKLLEREPELFAHLTLFLSQYKVPDIDCIAVTYGPGLEPALWVGINFAKALSLVWDKPIVAQNHMEGHIISSAVSADTTGLETITLPALALLISGGHTELILMKGVGEYEYLGRTRDDAVGEAYDKVARHMGLEYPGGPRISKLAEEARAEGLSAPFQLPRPMKQEDNYDFSFAGLKTAVFKIFAASPEMSALDKKKLAREFEDAAADVLVSKTVRAAQEYGVDTVIVGGGVSANTHIRSQFKKLLVDRTVLFAPLSLTGDNAVMIALAGYFHAQKNEFTAPENISATGSLKLD